MENTRELFQIMTRQFALLNKNCCSVGSLDISPVQSHILFEVSRQHKPSMQEIAETLGTDITTFSRQVQSLMKLNLLQKTPDSTDRRVYTLSLTTEGQIVADSIERQMNDYLDEVFSHLTVFEKETVLRSVRLFNEVLAKLEMNCNPVSG
ncbi:winged helix-turn-helix transcriptional regulator [Paenibacillus sp. Marseille-P2973]|uniref:MarR family winged helix-turn-helix transcriptional regulator n=1 Tax=unclassified Paenibacillus TaxID=185978 RepID=UPI001B3623F8|nr:MarR family winged helix-turn-helix transcriptional regulator [Paenibacillus sp. Marseille-P2973]MBQ4897930.1 winged helix-turn-helix transcriptional regulator [Paenibacillus sp. Marseille-P2973]